ncbi:hypothetical protein ACHAPG_006172 [Botrytis cinerea]
MPQLPSFLPPPPPPPAASSPDTFSVTLLESLTKFALGLMNLAPASGKNGRGRKESFIKDASNAKVKDRTQNPKAQTKTITYREGSSLRTSNFKLADRMTFPDPKWVTDRRTSNLIGHDEAAASDHFSENDARSDTEEALEDAASAAKAARKTISILKEDTDSATAATAKANFDQDAEAESVRKATEDRIRMNAAPMNSLGLPSSAFINSDSPTPATKFENPCPQCGGKTHELPCQYIKLEPKE